MSCKKMLPLIILSFLLLIHQCLGSKYLDKLLETHPTWSFALESVEMMIKDTIGPLKAIDPSLTEDIMREKIRADFGHDTTHLARKVGDPKWPRYPPTSFDAREKWKACAELISDIEDEGACYNDGPVVAASVASDRYCIFTNGTSKERLSAEMLAGCSALCTKTGRIFLSYMYITKHGIPTGGPYKSKRGCLPYELNACKHSNNSYLEDPKEMAWQSENGKGKLKPCETIMKYDHECPTKCSNPKYPISLDKDRKKFTSWYLLLSNEFQIRNEIFTYGPVATGIILFDDFFKYPEKGMYEKQPDADYVTWPKHVKLIGWGEENGLKYWIAVNTWDNWGKTKEFRIERGVNYVYIEDALAAGVYDD